MSEPQRWPSVSVVVPVLNEASHLRDAVRAIVSQDYPGPLEVCLALGPSTDDTNGVAAELTHEFANLRTVPNPTGATPAGLNAAIRATNGEVVVRVDGHAHLPAGYVTRAISTLERTGAVNVGGVQYAVGVTPFERAVASALRSPFGMGGARFHSGGREGPVDTVYLGAFRRSALEAVGLFDETLIRNQDYELNIRLRAAGGVVWFDPDLRVDYRPRPSLRALSRQFREYGIWKRHVLGLHPGSIKVRQVVPPLALVAIVVALLVAPWLPLALVVPAIYVAATKIVAAVTAFTDRVGAPASVVARLGNVARLLVIFPTMHFSWAVGFLTGRRQPARRSR